MLNLQDLTEVYKTMFDTSFAQTFVISGKIIGCFLIIISMYAKIFKNFGRWDKLLIKESEGHSLPYTLVSGLVLIGLILISTSIFTLTDNIFASIEKEFVEKHMGNFELFEYMEDPYEKERENEEFSIFNIEALLSKIVMQVHKVLSGSWIISGVMSLLMFMLDSIVYGMFLCERFFVLGAIKLLSPLILAFSVFEKFRSMLYDLMKVLLRWYLVIIPFFFVNIFCGAIVKNMPAAMTQIAGETGGEILFNSSRAIFLLFIIIIKFKLFSTSKSILKEIIK